MRVRHAMSPAVTSAATVAPAITVGTAPTSAPSRPHAIVNASSAAADREAPDARARRCRRKRAAETQQPDRGERDLELVAGAEEARAEHRVGTEQRALHEVGAERQVGHVQQRPRPRPGTRERAGPGADAVGGEREHRARQRDDQALDRRGRRERRGREQHGRQPQRGQQQRPGRATAGRRVATTGHCRDQHDADQAQPDHRPAARPEIGEPVAQLGELLRRGVAARLDRPCPTSRRGSRGRDWSSTVGATSVELTRPSVRVESE